MNISKQIKVVLYYITGIMLFVLLAINVLQVIMRFIFNNSLSWPMELSQYLIMWIIFLGIIPMIADGELSNFSSIKDKLSKRGRKIFDYSECFLIALLSAVLLKFGSSIFVQGLSGISPSLGLQLGWFYIVIPLSGLLTIYFMVTRFIRVLKGRG